MKILVATIPEDKLLLETDSPHLKPSTSPKTLRYNNPHQLFEVAKEVARIRMCDVNRILNVTTENAKRVFVRRQYQS